jgi:hypothetical protein
LNTHTSIVMIWRDWRAGVQATADRTCTRHLRQKSRQFTRSSWSTIGIRIGTRLDVFRHVLLPKLLYCHEEPSTGRRCFTHTEMAKPSSSARLERWVRTDSLGESPRERLHVDRREQRLVGECDGRTNCTR